MITIKENFDLIQKDIKQAVKQSNRESDSVTLIAVSKRKSVDTVLEGIKAGATNLGENYIQESIEKIDTIGIDKACWHFIGHLQSNKAKFAVKYFEYIHTIDSEKLAKEISKQAKKINKIQKILIQVNIADEITKSGATIDETIELVRKISLYEHVSIVGLMCMPPYYSDPEEARGYFKDLKKIQTKILSLELDQVKMDHLSMGMSNDFRVAIQEGATMVRVGTSIFGRRD